MFIRDFNQNGQSKIDKINKLLKEEFGMNIKSSYPEKAKIEKLLEMSNQAIVKLKDSSKNFQIQPEYAKYLGIRDIMETVLSEGLYADSPANIQMKEKLCAGVCSLMDSGYTANEAVTQCMVDFKKGPTAHSEEWALPIVMMAAKQYESSCDSHSESLEEIATEGPNTELNEYLLSELAREIGIELSDHDSMNAIEERLNAFATASGKTKESVVGFLNGLEEDAVGNGIKFFGAKIAKENFALAAAEADGEDFEYPKGSGKMHKNTMKKNTADKINNESMFDSIIDEMLSEEVESVEEAEVVMAVRALADDIQDHVERLGRMVNEDLPAIADQMVNEFGADKAAQFKTEAEAVLNSALESSKGAKDGVNGLVGSITGEDMGLGGDAMGDIEDPLGADSPIDDMDMPEPEMDINEPAAAGPEDEPLGRAPVEV